MFLSILVDNQFPRPDQKFRVGKSGNFIYLVDYIMRRRYQFTSTIYQIGETLECSGIPTMLHEFRLLISNPSTGEIWNKSTDL